MFLDYGSLFLVIIAVLVAGMMLGRVWWYITSREERIRQSRVSRGSSSYLLGMNYLISNQPDLALMELSRAGKEDPEAVEVQIILGNLYREKGQAERAIEIHKAVLDKKSISASERNLTTFCLGLDYRSAGFIDRAIQVFEDLRSQDPSDERTLQHLVKLYDGTGQLNEAYRRQQELIRLRRSDDYTILALLEVQKGQRAIEEGQPETAIKWFKKAIDLDPKAYPAYLHYGDLLYQVGRVEEAIQQWERLIDENYKRAHLIYRRLQKAYVDINASDRLEDLLDGIAAKYPNDWRSRFYLSHLKLQKGDSEEAFNLLKEAARLNPQNLAIHQRMWKLFGDTSLDEQRLQEYLQLMEENIFFMDPFVCIECGYRSTEFLWKCPHCHAYETFVEMRM